MYQFGPKTSIGLAMIAATSSIANFAYDASMINSLSIMPDYVKYFGLTHTTTGLLVAIINIGCIVGLPITQPILDKYGRKRGIFIGSALSALGAAISVGSPNLAAFMIGRLIIGVSFIINGAGAASWIMEISPPKYQSLLANTMLSSLPVAGTLASVIFLGIYDKSGEWAWRGGLIGELVGPLISMAVIPFTPESFRWLVANGRAEEALESMARLHAKGDRNDPGVLLEFREITETIAYEKENVASWKSLVHPAPQLRRFTIAVLLNIFFQISGSALMPYFFTLILVRAGVEDMYTLLVVSTCLCVWAAVANVSGIYLIEKLGPKKMLLISTPILSISFALLAILTARNDATGNPAYGKAACFVVFVFQWAAFSCWMILTYSYPSQILKYSQRSRGVSIAQAVGYAFAVLMSYTLPLAVNTLSWLYYAMNAGWNVGIIVLIWWLFVETKGKTIEEIDFIFEGKVHFNVNISENLRNAQVIDGVEVTKSQTASSITSKKEKKTMAVSSSDV